MKITGEVLNTKHSYKPAQVCVAGALSSRHALVITLKVCYIGSLSHIFLLREMEEKARQPKRKLGASAQISYLLRYREEQGVGLTAWAPKVEEPSMLYAYHYSQRRGT
jgi:hypothetical protein